MEVNCNCNSSARGLAEIDKQTNSAKVLDPVLFQEDIVHDHMQGKLYLSSKVQLPW